jgi:hypothetical protein
MQKKSTTCKFITLQFLDFKKEGKDQARGERETLESEQHPILINNLRPEDHILPA